MGYKNIGHFIGGMEEWTYAGYPVEKPERTGDEPTTKVVPRLNDEPDAEAA